jgi:hypothetical protein
MSDIIVPSSPKDLENIKAKIVDLSNLKTQIEAHADTIKEGIKALSETYGIEKKYISQMLTDYHKQQFDKKVHEKDSYESLYESIFG